MRVSVTADTGSCWEWSGARSRAGYGQFRRNGTTLYAHRAVCEVFHGPPQQGAHALHSCDNPPCVNPTHLSWGTHAENMRQRVQRGRSGPRPNRKLTHAAVLVIRREVAAGASHKSLADRYGVCRQLVSDVVAGKKWTSAEVGT